MNETTKKGLARMGKDFTEIAQGKTWTVTGRSFNGRDGIAYSAGMKAPKTNVKVFGWTLASDLFTLENARELALIITAEKHGETLATALIETAESVTKMNHETRFSAFTAIATAKGITTEKARAIITATREKATSAKNATAKTSTDYTAILGL